ncbi:hypothetical protein NECID01_0367 [Nematocida sp. AWRm77]|nr:hypothetical protein NECID01_0367 [Nematocida sp. AWRm77]
MEPSTEQIQEENSQFWKNVSSALAMNLEGVVDTKEIEKALENKEALAQIEALDVPSKQETIGGSKARRNRVLFSALITAMYSAAVAKDSTRIEEIWEYLESRMKDVDKTVRHNCMVFILFNCHSFPAGHLRRVAKTTINLLKNKVRSIRVFYFKLLCANAERFSVFLSKQETKHLFRTLVLVLNYSASQTKKDSYVIKKIFELACKISEDKEGVGEEMLSLLMPVRLADLNTPKVIQLLSRRLSKSFLNKTSVLDTISEKQADKDHAVFVDNLLHLLQWSIAHRKSIYAHYASLVHRAEISLEASCLLIKMLYCSPFQINKTEYLKWTEDRIDKLISAAPNEEPLSSGTMPALVAVYMQHLADESVDERTFSHRVAQLYKERPEARMGVIALFEHIDTPASLKLAWLIKEICMFSLDSPAHFEGLIKHINPFIHLDMPSIAKLLCQTNTLTFYTLLWYIYSEKQSLLQTEEGEEIVRTTVVFDILHKEFDIAMEFYVLLFSTRNTFAPGSAVLHVFSQVEEKLAKYFLDILHKTRRSREYLLSIFQEALDSLSSLIAPLRLPKTKECAASCHFLARHPQGICALLLYLLNNEEAYTNLLLLLQTVKPKEFSVSKTDTDTLKSYGVLNSKTAKRFQKLLSLADTFQDTGFSSVTQLSVSTTLDTNILEEK